jgi:predicted GTPase
MPDGVVAGFRMSSFSWGPDTDAKVTLKIAQELIFRPGINLITGQTGAGNSLLCNPIQLYLLPVRKDFAVASITGYAAATSNVGVSLITDSHQAK